MAGDARLKILRVRVVSGGGVPATVIAAPLVVACGDGALEIVELQRAGRGVQGVDEFRRGFPVAVGTRLT
jgi:methionyl-tRNA formyltransferase